METEHRYKDKREREREGERHDRQEGTPSRKQRDQTKGAGTETDNT